MAYCHSVLAAQAGDSGHSSEEGDQVNSGQFRPSRLASGNGWLDETIQDCVTEIEGGGMEIHAGEGPCAGRPTNRFSPLTMGRAAASSPFAGVGVLRCMGQLGHGKRQEFRTG